MLDNVADLNDKEVLVRRFKVNECAESSQAFKVDNRITQSTHFPGGDTLGAFESPLKAFGTMKFGQARNSSY